MILAVLLAFAAGLILAAGSKGQTACADASNYKDASCSPHQRAQALLKLMTWEEKVGQMGGIRRLLGPGASFNRTKYEELHATQNGILGYGTLANTAQSVLPKANAIREEQVNSTRLGIPYITETDSVNSILNYGGTLFPPTLSVGQSWNIPLFREVVAAIREENLALGTRWVLSPELDIAKEPRGGRVGEMYGEDAYLVGEFATNYIETMQQKDEKGYVKVATTAKHFLYGQSKGGVNTASQHGGLNFIFNEIAPPFIRAIREVGPLSVMASYSSVDRVPVHASRHILQGLLRGKMGFGGLIMSDAHAISNLHTQSKVASSPLEAALKALGAGIQLELSPALLAVFPTLIGVLVANGSTTAPLPGRAGLDLTEVKRLVDAAVLQVLLIKFATGTFDLPLPTAEALNSTLRHPRHLELSRNVSRESVVLLRNDGLLPLKFDVAPSPPSAEKKIALIGPLANVLNAGGYAPTNSINPPAGRNLLQALRAKFGAESVAFAQAVDFASNNRSSSADGSSIASAVELAKAADVAVLVLGALNTNTEDPLAGRRTDGEFFARADLGLPGLQQELLDTVLGTGVPTILVLSGGAVFCLPESTLTRTKAVLHSFLAGEDTADALADILDGTVNPSGKLTVTFPQAQSAIPAAYDFLPSDNAGGGGSSGSTLAWQYPALPRANPSFAFGYGLSYTTFEISAPSIVVSDGTPARSSSRATMVKVSTTVRNTGPLTGKEVVQVYFRQQYTRIETPVKQLIRFEKVDLAPGEARDVTFVIPSEELGYYVEGEWQVDPGNYTFWVGSSSRDADLKGRDVAVNL